LADQVRAKDLEISAYNEAMGRWESELVAATSNLQLQRRRASTLDDELAKLKETRKNLLEVLPI
jgi:hypothetical protein